MSFRNLYIQKPCQLKLKNNQLVVIQDVEHFVPIVDINAIILEHSRVTITIPTLSALAENKVAVYTCNERHIPNGVLLPMGQYSRKLQAISSQISTTKRTKDRIWQKIVKQKIINQARCLHFMNKSLTPELMELSKVVEEGDRTYQESQAARIYFMELFEDKLFNRREDTIQNGALNYGYAIIRGVIAREIVAYGFEPSLGVHHKSELNAFNLADDLIEPFRPIVDLWVADNIPEGLSELHIEEKLSLVSLLNTAVLIDKSAYNLKSAVQQMVSSFSTCLRTNSSRGLKLPTLVALEQHEYE